MCHSRSKPDGLGYVWRRNYRILFWSLRFHGRLFFRHLYVDVQRIWQPEDKQIRCVCCLAERSL